MEDPDHASTGAPMTRDLFAEMYVAGVLADDGWSIYFPRRDVGFDFIATAEVDGQLVMRSVQVKGKFPTAGKTDKATYGFRGRLSQVHPDMVLAMPFFDLDRPHSPLFTAYIPFATLVPWAGSQGGYRCHPALFADGTSRPRKAFKRFVDASGVALMRRGDWGRLLPDRDGEAERRHASRSLATQPS